MTRFLALFFCLLLFALPARADTYIKPTWPDLVRTLVHFNAIGTDDNALIDEYAIISECALYEKFYGDDFKWNDVRTALRDSLQKHATEFPVTYAFVTQMQLDRYDFNDKLFRFTDASAVRSVNAITFYQAEGSPCGKARLKYLPKGFRAVIGTPVYILGIPMQPEDAKALLRLMQSEDNLIRAIYARFDLTLTYADQLRKNVTPGSPVFNYAQNGHVANDAFQFDARLDSVEFFADQAMTEHIYTFVPH